MLRAYAVIAILLFAVSVNAQTPAPAAAAEPATAWRTPPLVSTTVVASNESPLVLAAKRAVAARQKGTSIKIDDARLAQTTKTITTTDNLAPEVPVSQGREAAAPAGKPIPYVDRQGLEAKKRELEQKVRQAMSDEEEGPYADGNEDTSAARMGQTVEQLRETERKLQSAPPPPPQ
jgi:hypothetical protein